MPARILVNINGPLKVEGDFAITDATGAPIDTMGKQTVFLCRCGQSKNAPFCDGSHKTSGFQSEVKGTAKT